MQDISDQVLQERDLAQRFLEITEAIIVSMDVSGRVCLLNHTGQKILGYREQDIIGKSWIDIAVPAEQRAAVRKDFEDLIARGDATPIRFENEVLTRSGERIYVRWNDTVVRNDAGEPVSVLSSGIDITELKRAEQALRESAERLKDYSDASSDWFWEMGADLRFTFISPSFTRILGMPAERLLGKTRNELINPDTAPANFRAKWAAHLDDLNNHRPFRDFEFPTPLADGKKIYLRVSGKPIFDDSGAFIGYRGSGCEVTREVEAQQRASRAQSLLMHTVEHVPTMMVLFDAEDRFVMCNQAYRDALPAIADLLHDGTTFEEISRVSAQRGLVEAYRDDPEGWVRYRMERFRNPGDPVVHQQLDGRWVMTSDHRTPDGGTLIMRTDITAAKKAEDEVRAKEATILSFLDAMIDPAAMVDLEANFILANKAMADEFGVEPRDLIGRSMFKNPPSEIGRKRRALMDQVATTGQAVHSTDHYEGRWHDITLTPVFDTNGVVDKIALVARDITHTVTTDSMLRTMSQATEQSADLVVITDVKGNIEYVNRQFTTVTGYEADEVMGKNPRLLASGDTPKAVYRELWNTVLMGQTWRGDLKDRRKDGTFFWAAVTITPIHDDSGTIVNFVSSHVDISDRKASEEAMREAMLRTEIANRSKTELLANMSHELRTPLNAIIGFSDTMRHGTFGPISNEKYAEYIDDINDSGVHLLNLVNDILDVSAIEVGKLSLNEEVLDVTEVLDASIRLLAPRIDQGGLQVFTAYDANHVKLHADERRLKQIALNLLSNAAKFTDVGGEIHVSVSLTPQGALEIAFADTGIGMNTKEVAIAMTKFGQVDGGLARKHQGTGLGLPLTQKLVEAHDGTLIISSKKGHGTTVTIRFPQDRVTA